MDLGEKYDFTQFDLEQLRQKKHPITWKAYWICFNRDPETVRFQEQKLHICIPLDCDGAPVPTSVSGDGSQVFAQICPGAEWSYPNYTNYNNWGYHPLPGFIMDKRTWLDMIRGCCPGGF
jgi:hypothetical protein